MVINYWRRVHRRALSDARHALLLESKERVVIAIILAVIGLALIWLFGAHEAALHELIVRLALTSAILLAFPFVYIWKFITAPAALDHESTTKLASATADIPRITILDASFDQNGPTEFYMDIRIVNPEPPTTFNNWNLSIEGATKSLLAVKPRFVHGGFPIQNVFGGVDPDDVSRHPIITGAVRQVRLGFTFAGYAQNYFSIAETRFKLTVEDARRNIIEAEFVGS